jgi:hypothetical protein
VVCNFVHFSSTASWAGDREHGSQERGFLHIALSVCYSTTGARAQPTQGPLSGIFNLSLYVVRNTSSYARRIGGIYDIFKRLSDVVYIKTLVGFLVAMFRNYQPG